jgi:predicted ester cyclase
MSRSEYQSKIERLYKAIETGDVGVVDDIVHPDYVYHGGAGIGPGPEGMKTMIREVQVALTGLQNVIDDLIVEGDQSVVRYSTRGTHTGEFAGAPATGNYLDVTGIAIYRWSEGKIIEEWDHSEEIKAFTTLGLLPASQ